MNKNIKTALIIGGIILVILIIFPLIFGPGYGRQGNGYGMMGPGMMGGFAGGPIFMILFWGLVIWGVIALVQGAASPRDGGGSNQTGSALEILKRRYARGEITKQEYEERRKDLV